MYNTTMSLRNQLLIDLYKDKASGRADSGESECRKGVHGADYLGKCI